jgi:hypothetical protein
MPTTGPENFQTVNGMVGRVRGLMAEIGRLLKFCRDQQFCDNEGLTWREYLNREFGLSEAAAQQMINEAEKAEKKKPG